jgi:hypothetical protein
MYFLAGLLLAFPLKAILIKLYKLNSLWLGVIVVFFTLLIFLIDIPYNYHTETICIPGYSDTYYQITEYASQIRPKDYSRGVFSFTEEVVYLVETRECNEDGKLVTEIVENNLTLSAKERLVFSSNRGLFIREVRITPLETTLLQGTSCCPKTKTVELIDFPRNSFYEVRYVPEVSISSYLDTETVKWSDFSIGRNIEFAYIIRPFNSLRRVLLPFIPLLYQSDWVVAFVGILFTTVFTSIINPAISDFGRNRLKTLLTKKSPSVQKQAKIIVTSKGDEKLINLEEDD